MTITLNFKTNKFNATAANYSHLITFIIQLWFINLTEGERRNEPIERMRDKYHNYYDSKQNSRVQKVLLFGKKTPVYYRPQLCSDSGFVFGIFLIR